MSDTIETPVNVETPAAAKPVLEVRNGQSDKRHGTIGRRSWDICDELTITKGSAPSVVEVLAVSNAEGINPGQMRAAYAQWRKFHGLQGVRIDNPEKAANAEAKAAEKAAKEAEKASAAGAKAAEKEAKAAEKAAIAEAKAAEKAAIAEAKAAEKAAVAEAKAAAKAEAAAIDQAPPAQPE